MSIEYMLAFNWNSEILEEAKRALEKWDARPKSFYKNTSKLAYTVDMSEKEHYRNCVQFWEERLKNEN